MRITIETDEQSRMSVSGDVAGREAASETKAVDAGPAPLEHIHRLQAQTRAREIDAGAVRITPSRIAERETPLNPLRAGAAHAKGTTIEQSHVPIETTVATTDAGRAVHKPEHKEQPSPAERIPDSSTP